MPNKTQIEWCRNPDGSPGFTWNPITGCLNGCPYCYARGLANTWLKGLYLANKNICRRPGALPGRDPAAIADPFWPRFWQEKLMQPYNKTTRWGSCRRYTQKAKGIFVCDMSDLFGIGIPEEWTRRVLKTVTDCPQHRFYLLTKQPQNLAKFSPFPDNCYVGVSATNQHQFDEAMKYLKEVEATVKYISFEPLLAHISCLPEALTCAGIRWAILGAQSKPTVMPKRIWVREIVSACDKAGVKVFLKNSLLEMFQENHMGWNGLRQEFPAPQEKVICVARDHTE